MNELTSIFFLSDGEDTTGHSLDDILSSMTMKDEEMSELNIEYSLTTFGYGANHDEKVLSGMSEFKNGDFYYIKSNEFVDQTFLESLGKLMSVLAKNVGITVIASN